MNTEKIKTLELVLEAMDIVENARSMTGLTNDERFELEKAAIQLRNIERSIIRIKTSELVDKLASDTEALKELSERINKSAEKLAGIAKALEKAANTVESFINIASQAIKAGLI